MCGINGILSQNVTGISENTIKSFRSSIHYRGKDEQNEWRDEKNIFLGHARLSIIDLVTGQQPMRDISGRYVIVYNGEIYNYKELRENYKKLGARFHTESDTEVILEGFKIKGEEICPDLNGMFAFAIWDTLQKRLFLARDHLGKKPLYWCSYNGNFYFSSTIDSFRSIQGWHGRLSIPNLMIYNSLSGFPENITIYENIYAVPYASCGYILPGQTQIKCERFWRMDFSRKSSNSFSDLLDEYESILTDSINIRLRSDVPLAHTFSGGVDSGTIAAIATKKLDVPLGCYTIDYNTPDDPSEETVIAEKVARHLGLNWQYIHFNYHEDLLSELPAAYAYYDQPSVQLAVVYSHRLYKAIKPFATVVLSGNGSDELFTGYNGDENIFKNDLDREKKIKFVRPIQSIVNLLWTMFIADKNKKNILDKAVSKLFGNYINHLVYIPKTYSNTIINKLKNSSEEFQLAIEVMNKISHEAMESNIDSHLDYAMFANLTYATTDTNYRLPDISGLANQVEVRSPYLDYRMVEFAARLPHKYKVGDVSSNYSNKYLPKVYYEKFVSPDIAWAKKKGMGYNLKWDQNIIYDEAFHRAFSGSYRELNSFGIDSFKYEDAWKKYIGANGNPDYYYTNLMMIGFMLANWLKRKI
jgi:asparagine synthase (glutamine-hydrolysing)